MRGLSPNNPAAITAGKHQDGPSLNSVEAVIDAMESKRIEMCQVIKQEVVMRVRKEAEYESGRERAVREAIEEAKEVIDKQNSK